MIDISALFSKGLEQGGLALVCIVLLWVLQNEIKAHRTTQSARLDEQKSLTEERRFDKKELVEAFRANTAALAGLTAVIERNTRATEGCELARDALADARLVEREKEREA